MVYGIKFRTLCAAIATAILVGVSGCQSGAGGCGPSACGPCGGGPGGGGGMGANCFNGSTVGGYSDGSEMAGLQGMNTFGGLSAPSGPLGDMHANGRYHRGPQSHMGSAPGPAAGPPHPTVTYPYYTTRGPRDFLTRNPPSIGP